MRQTLSCLISLVVSELRHGLSRNSPEASSPTSPPSERRRSPLAVGANPDLAEWYVVAGRAVDVDAQGLAAVEMSHGERSSGRIGQIAIAPLQQGHQCRQQVGAHLGQV